MNRKLKRIIEKKLGSDFPLDKFSFLCDNLDLDPDELILYILRKYIPCEFNIKANEVIEINEEDNFMYLFNMRNHVI